ncbi:YcxB family protein [Allorhodopirellula solitaria]|uniref:YcxB-like C-terminal domain-containing protein n=1 Tax=Allorhodopirellula solitaria TaxID=2527987 RepID=A0A5C5XSC2_9BACT|nr:YcxB family protein [Allorhodopirellula solitaria]TWT66107.1 hypothetical protein CA85_29710 [Allorhodopirellula solitaria]
MSPANPYEPPTPVSRPDDDAAIGSADTITATYLFTADHLLETLSRYRSQHLGRRIWTWFRFAIAIMLLAAALVGLFVPQYIASAVMFAMAVFMFFPHKIDNFFARRNFRRSPYCNTEHTMRFSDQGLESSSDVQESTLKWGAFSQAVIFPDGILIFQGPKMVHWIPDDSLQRSSDAERLRELVTSKLPTN